MSIIAIVLLSKMRRWRGMRLKRGAVCLLHWCALILTIVLERGTFILPATATTAATTTAFAFWIRLVAILIVVARCWSALLQIVLLVRGCGVVTCGARPLRRTTFALLRSTFSLLAVNIRLLIACIQTIITTITTAATTITPAITAVVITALLAAFCSRRLRATFVVTCRATIVLLSTTSLVTAGASIATRFVAIVWTTSTAAAISATTIILAIATALLTRIRRLGLFGLLLC